MSNGEEIEILANAATPYRFKQIFGLDLMKIIGKSSEEDNGMGVVEIVPQLAYVMNQQAKKADLMKLNMETFLTWSESFESGDFIENAEKIIDTYIGTTITTSVSKKKKN